MKQYIVFIILSFISGIIASQMNNIGLSILFALWSMAFGLIGIGKLIDHE